MEDFGVTSPISIINPSLCASDIHVRCINITKNKFAEVLGNRLRPFGVNRLQILYLSGSAIEMTSPEIFRTFMNLRFLNLSHNVLVLSHLDFCKTFSPLRMLEVVDLSNNKLNRISPEAFENCSRLRRLNLADNELTEVDINMRHLSDLEHISMETVLSNVFTGSRHTTRDVRLKLRRMRIN